MIPTSATRIGPPKLCSVCAGGVRGEEPRALAFYITIYPFKSPKPRRTRVLVRASAGAKNRDNTGPVESIGRWERPSTGPRTYQRGVSNQDSRVERPYNRGRS